MREPIRKSDKTFTLRLTKEEAEALERMTFIENETRPGGQSKNKFIEELIANEYAKYDTHAVLNNKVRFVTPPDVFAKQLAENVELYAADPLDALAAIEYAIIAISEEVHDDDSEDDQKAILEELTEEKKYLYEKLQRAER